ncbi:uncharacterized protein EV420DRAFT_170644 [Desarmillaria tabescens]|uniref:Uncharacterized protein n=1 Tax=Armillaria tabescens TaxID=1929756 RepID=A0AA39TR03_ARMTA|nr:uncharacterized protein EV420DRAFT_170644 [Desarmillaria tabescens]KAK0460994.1 hypothetical protein EV420DRAFT_170644 [Desarmillaria tabescens]
MLPFFPSQPSSTASESWPIVLTDVDWIIATGEGKKINRLSQFKTVPGGSVGWFACTYSDAQQPGYGTHHDNWKPQV